MTAALIAAALVAPGAEAIPLPQGTQIEWTHAAHPRPLRYRSGDVTVTVRGERRGDGLIRPLLRIEAPGRPAATMRAVAVSPIMPNRIGVGTLDRAGTPFVYWQSYTGGAHCCNAIRVAVVAPGRIRTVELGAWDGEPQEAFPSDVDGDGTVDFVQSDQRFRYAFASGAGSRTPPQILNIEGGRAVDVSAHARFRPLFEADMAANRAECLDRGSDRNGACAAFVASAARIGRLGEAWAEMLAAHEPTPAQALAFDCRVAWNERAECPRGQEIRFGGFPEALRHFLTRWGYIPR